MQSHSSEWKWLRPNTLLLLFLIYFSRFSKQNNITHHHHHRRKILKKLQVHWLLEKPLQQQENLAHCKLCSHLLVYNKCNNFCNTWSTTTITTTSTLSFSRNFFFVVYFIFFFFSWNRNSFYVLQQQWRTSAWIQSDSLATLYATIQFAKSTSGKCLLL